MQGFLLLECFDSVYEPDELKPSYGWLSKLWSLLGSLLKFVTEYLGYCTPKGIIILTTTHKQPRLQNESCALQFRPKIFEASL